jgi:hypothetical protein
VSSKTTARYSESTKMVLPLTPHVPVIPVEKPLDYFEPGLRYNFANPAGLSSNKS